MVRDTLEFSNVMQEHLQYITSLLKILHVDMGDVTVRKCTEGWLMSLHRIGLVREGPATATGFRKET